MGMQELERVFAQHRGDEGLSRIANQIKQRDGGRLPDVEHHKSDGQRKEQKEDPSIGRPERLRFNRIAKVLRDTPPAEAQANVRERYACRYADEHALDAEEESPPRRSHLVGKDEKAGDEDRHEIEVVKKCGRRDLSQVEETH